MGAVLSQLFLLSFYWTKALFVYYSHHILLRKGTCKTFIHVTLLKKVMLVNSRSEFVSAVIINCGTVGPNTHTADACSNVSILSIVNCTAVDFDRKSMIFRSFCNSFFGPKTIIIDMFDHLICKLSHLWCYYILFQ